MRVLIERIAVLLIASAVIGLGTASAQVKTDAGAVEGTTNADGVRAFLGVPYAAPPWARCDGRRRSRLRPGLA